MQGYGGAYSGDPYAFNAFGAMPQPYGAPQAAMPMAPMGMAPPFSVGGGGAAMAPVAAAAAAAVPGAMGVPEELRTVFITGFPQDIKERELNNLLRFIPGYEASQMNWKNGQAQGFALFCNNSMARTACDQIAGLCFDDNVTLRAEMAHKNMYIRDELIAGTTKRMRTSGSYSGTLSGGGGFGGGGGMGSVGGAGGSMGGGGGGGGGGGSAGGARPAGGYGQVQNTKDNPPCNTLFVGNLGDGVEEAELQSIFSVLPGYLQLKLLRGGRNISCFVEFDTTEHARQCHVSQQGAVLRSSDRGPIRVQYSKSPFGRKRDAHGHSLDGSGGGAQQQQQQQQQLRQQGGSGALASVYSGGGSMGGGYGGMGSRGGSAGGSSMGGGGLATFDSVEAPGGDGRQ